MKLLSFIAILLAAIFTALIFYGVTLSDKTEITQTIVIEAPKTVVWNSLSNFSEKHKWLKSIETLYNFNFSARQVHYLFKEKTILVNQQVRLRENANTIDYFQIGQEKYTELQDFSGQISVSSLADGSSEVQWKITYTTETLSQKLVNQFSLVPKINQLLKINLLSFRNYIDQ